MKIHRTHHCAPIPRPDGLYDRPIARDGSRELPREKDLDSLLDDRMVSEGCPNVAGTDGSPEPSR